MKNIFDSAIAEEVIRRINKLAPDTPALWGKMSVDQMLAHCNVPYLYTFEPERYTRPGPIQRFFLRYLVKNMVVGEKPYPKNSRTARTFIVEGKRNFEKEREILIENVRRCQYLGASFFEGKENHSFGPMTSKEWNGLFYKHLDHHLTQFGV
jgi:hypothetical protein